MVRYIVGLVLNYVKKLDIQLHIYPPNNIQILRIFVVVENSSYDLKVPESVDKIFNNQLLCWESGEGSSRLSQYPATRRLCRYSVSKTIFIRKILVDLHIECIPTPHTFYLQFYIFRPHTSEVLPTSISCCNILQ